MESLQNLNMKSIYIYICCTMSYESLRAVETALERSPYIGSDNADNN